MTAIAVIAAVLMALFAAGLASPSDAPTPPIGWFFVVLMAESLGAVLATVAAP